MSRLASAADHAACRAILRHGSRSFLAASLLLPSRLRAPATALYAFCRISDDSVDEAGEADPAAALARLRERLRAAAGGRPQSCAVDRALADTLARFAIPVALPEALLEGFAWDLAGRRYRDLAGLRAYGVRVAGSVGAMMALLMGQRDPATLARAVELGVAMQLTNIARDIGADARAGRLYLPLDWLDEAGIDPEVLLAGPRFSPALGAMTGRLLDEAGRLYRSADAGIAALPPACRPAIRVAQRTYRAIGDEILARGGDSVGSRAVVPTARRLAILGGAVLPTRPGGEDAPLAEAAGLLAAVPAGGAAGPAPRRPPLWARIDGRIDWTLALFERLAWQEGRPGG